MILTIWDIENINFNSLKSHFKDFKNSNKIFVHNNVNIPIKNEQREILLKNKWKYVKVKPGKDSADRKIQGIISNNLNKYDKINLITSDNGFSDIVIKTIKSNTKITLYTNSNSNKLVRKIYNKYYHELDENHLIQQYLNIKEI